MSLENGDNMFDYCSDIFLRYKDDDTIFIKTLPILQYFQNRKDYPYCLTDLDKVFENIMGISLSVLANSSSKYIDFDEVYWDIHNTVLKECNGIDLVEGLSEEEGTKLAKKFEKEFCAFCITIKPALNEVFMMENHPMKLKQLTYQHLFNEDGYNIRIIRNDNIKLDLIVKDSDINFMIHTLHKIVGEDN